MTATAARRPLIDRSPLRLALAGDGIATTSTGVALLPLAWALDSLLGLDAAILFGVGLAFVGIGTFVLFVGTRSTIPRRAAWGVAGINAFWTVDSSVTLASGVLEPTTLGAVAIVLIAVFTAVMSAVQIFALRAAR